MAIVGRVIQFSHAEGYRYYYGATLYGGATLLRYFMLGMASGVGLPLYTIPAVTFLHIKRPLPSNNYCGFDIDYCGFDIDYYEFSVDSSVYGALISGADEWGR